jgi:hypothetical protein
MMSSKKLQRYFAGLVADAISKTPLGMPLRSALRPFAKAYQALENRAKGIRIIKGTETQAFMRVRKILCDSLEVKNGPFKGMRYSTAASAGSSLYPKLIGTYERELTPFIDDILARQFELIVDIGAAEGYYAVGFAMRMKGRIKSVVAYDTDPKARALCAANALINSVSVAVEGFCDSTTLIDACAQTSSMIIIDAEGYEKVLISEGLTKRLSHCSFLVESHDCFDIDTTNHLINCFSSTHKIKLISSIDDIEKAYTYMDLEEFGLSLHDKKMLFQEGRQTIMKWIYATPLEQNGLVLS